LDLYPGSQTFGLYNIHTFAVLNSAQSYYQNGVFQGSRGSSTNTMNTGNVRLGARFFSGVEQGNAALDLAEALIFNRVLSAQENDLVLNYLRRKWQIAPSKTQD
jgi:hypothetical protein